MRIRKSLPAGVICAAVLAAAGGAAAGPLPIYYDSPAALAAAGVIDQVTNFDSYDPTVVTVTPGFTDGLITVPSIFMEVMGATAFSPNLVRNLMTNDGYPPHDVSGTFTGQENLFGLSFGDIGLAGTASLGFFFDDDTGYVVFVKDLLATAPDGALSFVGVQAPTGRYFTSFSIGSDQEGLGGFIGVTDLTLGHTAGRCVDTSIACGGGGGCVDTSHPCDGGGGVPEPDAWALLILGFGGIGAMVRRRRSAFA